MELNEIIAILRNEKSCVLRNVEKSCSRDCGSCDLVLPDRKILTAYDMAILTMRSAPRWKKQISQRVRFEDAGYDTYLDYNIYACICPSCGVELIRFNDGDIDIDCDGDVEKAFKSCMVHHAYAGRNSYCDRCGQKLDWGSYHRKKVEK